MNAPALRGIDVHAHYFPPSFLSYVQKNAEALRAEYKEVPEGITLTIGAHTIGPIGKNFSDLKARINRMDEQRVSMQVLSLSQPMVDWAGEQASALAQVFNDALATAHAAYPGRLYGLATLPMRTPEKAVVEVRRAAELPGVCGCCISTNIGGKDLSHPDFFRVYDALETADIPLFLHPVEVLARERLAEHYFTNLLGNPFETAIAASHLIYGGVLDRFPRLRVVLPHAGGAFPWLVGRLQRGFDARPELRSMKLPPDQYLRRFWFDTIGYSDGVIDYLVTLVGADRVMMGSDYCYTMGDADPRRRIEEHPRLSEAEKSLILEDTARMLIRIP